MLTLNTLWFIEGACECRGGGRHIGHKLRVGGDVGRYTRYSQVLTPYTEDWGNNKTAEWYAGKKVNWLCLGIIKINANIVFPSGCTNNKGVSF